MRKDKINPTKVLVTDIVEDEKKTASGIIIPGTAKTPSMRGRVVLVGRGTPEMPIEYSKGDVVYYRPMAGSKFNMDDVDYRLVDVQEIFLGYGEAEKIDLGKLLRKEA